MVKRKKEARVDISAEPRQFLGQGFPNLLRTPSDPGGSRAGGKKKNEIDWWGDVLVCF